MSKKRNHDEAAEAIAKTAESLKKNLDAVSPQTHGVSSLPNADQVAAANSKVVNDDGEGHPNPPTNDAEKTDQVNNALSSKTELSAHPKFSKFKGAK